MHRATKEKLFSKRNVFFYILSVAVFIIVIFHFAEIKSVAKLFNQIEPLWLLVALFAQFLTYVSLSVVYRTLLSTDDTKIRINISEYLKLSMVSIFLNQTIPTGGISGNIFIVQHLVKKGVEIRHALSVVIMEIITFYIASITMAIAVIGSFILYHHNHVPGIFLITLIIGCAFYGVLMIFMSFVGAGHSVSSFVKKMYESKFVHFFLKKLQTMSPEIVHLKNPWPTLLHNRLLMFKAILFQLILYLLDTMTVFALFHGFHTQLSFWIVLIGFIPTTIIGSLPLSPGSLLVYETGMTFFYTSLGVPFSAALVITLLYRTLSFWIPMPIGLVLYRHLQIETHKSEI